MTMKKRSIYIIFLLMVSVMVSAQKLTVSAPHQVGVGDQFQVEYTVNSQDVRGFHPGNMPDGVEILYGPSTSSQSSFHMVNGHTSSSSSMTISYVMRATKKGTFTIPPAQANVGGRSVASSAVRISATGGTRVSHSNGNASMMQEDDFPTTNHHSSAPPRQGEDVFIRVSANKKSVHEQEPVLLTYQVYTLVDLTALDGKMPDLKGFHTQEVKLPMQKTFHREQVNGRYYNTVTWSQYVMYPQMTGDLEIPPITFHGVVMQEVRDPMAFILNGGYEEVKRDIKAPGLKIHVAPLPTKPEGFSGGVGTFTISAQLNQKELKAGDPLNMRLVVSGVGNLKLIKQPEVVFPQEFDKYDAKVTDKTHLTARGVEGNMVYDILAVPRKEGSYTIQPVKFVYYDTSSNSYKTIQTQAFTVKVEKGDGTQASEVSDFTSLKNEDIRGIKTGRAVTHTVGDIFFGSVLYWFILLVLLVVFGLLLYMFRKTAIDHADVAKMRGKRANKIATKRLKKASRLMALGSSDDFYDEVLRALWGYVSDKLNMPVEQLSRDNISERLSSHGVDEVTVGNFIDALDECEFERYAPGDAKGNMNKTFDKAMDAIMTIENAMKTSKPRHGKDTVAMLSVLFMMMLPMPLQAVTKDNADTEYKKGNYQQAIKDYEELLQKGVSADLYYNLGNAYYRVDNITKAVLAYERALLLSPGDEDIRFNLQMARSKTIDKITPASEMFFVTWYKALVNLMSVDGWAYVAIGSLLLLILFVLAYLFSERIWIRKVGFFCGIVSLVLFVLANVFAIQQRSQLSNRTGAIVTAPSVSVKKTPGHSAQEECVLHEGTRVEMTDKSMKGWVGISLADGREGWIESTKIEEI